VGDEKVLSELQEMDWIVVVIWECEIVSKRFSVIQS
jgi:G:T-mismatch repair DNA endonuclease (very short patch repair protein)